jgi:formylglycine-generating enzyme required for sulfatase activity
MQDQDLKPGDGTRDKDGAPVEITPVSFRPDTHQRGLKPSKTLKWLLSAAFAAILVFLCISAWFVFTARKVQIHIIPQPDKIKIRGGVAAPQIGTYYLLRPGDYILEAARQCYHPLNEQFTVGTGKSRELNFSMTKLPGKLSLRAHRSGIASAGIEGARVLIDGTEVGNTPVADLDVKAGRRAIEVRAPKYQSYRAEMDVEGCGLPQQFDIALIPGWSDITIDSIPSGADVRIDGKSIGRTPLQFEMPAGDYELELHAERFKSWRTRLEVEVNRPRVFDTVRLQPADGKLTLQTNPPGANVMLENTYVGQSPMELSLAPDTSHSIHLSKSGYEKAVRSVNIGSGQAQTLTVKLKPRLGLVNLKVEPADAEILVDGQPMGKVPRQLRLVAVEHRLEITKKGYQPYQIRITPRPGFEQQINVTLVKLPGEKKAAAGIIAAKNGYELKLVRPRPYTMGSSRREQGRRSNETLREIKLQRPFYMGIREVTNKEFRQFLSAHNSGEFKGHSLDREALPVARITWEQAALFCNWLSVKESLPPVYRNEGGKLRAADPAGNGYRLPTEAEWEYCARFDKSTADLKYPWGDTYPPTAKSGNFADVSAKDLLVSYLPEYNDGYAVSAPPAKFNVNSLGLYDMGGNIMEWCHDYYAIYPYNAGKVYTDPMGPKEGKHHVVRGSGWTTSGISELRLSYRDYSDTKRPDLGFRICRYAQ